MITQKDIQAHKVLFEVKTKTDILVSTTQAYWDVITHVKHPTLRGKEKEVKRALCDPDEIRISKKTALCYCFIGRLKNMVKSFFPVKVNMKHRSVTHNFILLPIPNPSVEQAQPPVFSVSGTKRAALPDLPLSLASSSSRTSVLRHQPGQHRLNSGSSFPLENAGLPWSGVYSLPAASLRGLWNGYSCDALAGTLTHRAHPQGFPQSTPSPTGNHHETARLYPWLSLILLGSLSRKKQNESTFSSWYGYPSAACLGYSSSYAPGTVESKNKGSIPGASSLSRSYRQRLPKEAHSNLLVSDLSTKSLPAVVAFALSAVNMQKDFFAFLGYAPGNQDTLFLIGALP